MDTLSPETMAALPAVECGRVCALAGEGQRDLQACAETYGSTFPGHPFDPTFFSTVALSNAFSAYWLTADRLRTANRAALWAFGVDWLIDHLATSRGEVEDIVRRCLAVAYGAEPEADDPISCLLADIRADLANTPSYSALLPIWCDQVRRTLDAMAREWEWRSAGRDRGAAVLPTPDQYLQNADNLGFAFVYVSHWSFTHDPRMECHADRLRTAGWQVQQVIRLLNDLGTYRRDVEWGDLNVLMLGLNRTDVIRRIETLADDCRQALGSLRADHPDVAAYLERQINFNIGFWKITDYWGSL
jgi:hypothetical protein